MNWDELIPRLQSRLKRRYPNSPDVVQETLTRLFIRITGGLEIKVSVEALAIGIAENVQREARRAEDRFTGIVTEFADIEKSPSFPEPAESELAALKKRVFSPTERKLFDEYYSFRGNVHLRRERLARKLGVSMNTLYQRMFRLKERLMEEHRNQRLRESAH